MQGYRTAFTYNQDVVLEWTQAYRKKLVTNQSRAPSHNQKRRQAKYNTKRTIMGKKKIKRRLRKPIRIALEVIVCLMIAFAIAVGLLMNASTQVDRYNDPYYIQSRIG